MGSNITQEVKNLVENILELRKAGEDIQIQEQAEGLYTIPGVSYGQDKSTTWACDFSENSLCVHIVLSGLSQCWKPTVIWHLQTSYCMEHLGHWIASLCLSSLVWDLKSISVFSLVCGVHEQNETIPIPKPHWLFQS